MIKNKLNNIISEVNSYVDIFLNKNLAKLGDNYVNFIYSIARSIRTKEISGQKVAGKILKNAIKDSNLSEYLPTRLSSHDIADGVEALIVYVWLIEKMDINEMVEILVSELNLGDFSTRRNEFDSAILAFIKLLNEIEKLKVIKETI